MSFSQWINDRRWGANIRRARAFRRNLSFSQRAVFDKALRPKLPHDHGLVVDYPDALYHISIDDLCRAIRVVAIGSLPPAERAE